MDLEIQTHLIGSYGSYTKNSGRYSGRYGHYIKNMFAREKVMRQLEQLMQWKTASMLSGAVFEADMAKLLGQRIC